MGAGARGTGEAVTCAALDVGRYLRWTDQENHIALAATAAGLTIGEPPACRRLLHRETICDAPFKMRLPVKPRMAPTRALHPSSVSLHPKNR